MTTQSSVFINYNKKCVRNLKLFGLIFDLVLCKINHVKSVMTLANNEIESLFCQFKKLNKILRNQASK